MSSYILVRGTSPDGDDRIELGERTLVGRSDDCDLTVSEGHPSRRHAQLTVEDGELWLEDLGSANGTFVNDRPVSERTRLQHGDRVAFDLATFVVFAPDASSADDDATVVRPVERDADATVVRPPPAAPEARQPAEPPPDQKQAPAAEPHEPTAPGGPTPEASSQQVPRSWADPDYQPAGTRVLTPEELKAMAAGGAAPGGSASAVAGPHLAVINGNSAGAVLEFPREDGEWTVGTEAGRDLVLTDDGISAFHAKISHDQGRWRVIDQMSANGTFVNGDKATVSYLKNGDRLRFAQVECELRLPDVARARKTAATNDVRSSGRTWLIAGLAAAATVGVLALMSLL